MLKVIFLILVIFSCNSCIKSIHTSGHLFEEKELKDLEKANNKQDVENILGSPSTVSSFGPETWYYITSKKERIAFLKDKVLEQTILAIAFKKDGKIDVIAKYSEKDMKNNHKLIPEITLVRGNNTTTAQQFFGNLGKFNNNKKETPQTPRSGF